MAAAADDELSHADSFEIVLHPDEERDNFEQINALVLEFSGGAARIRGGTGTGADPQDKGLHMLLSFEDVFDLDVAIPHGFPRRARPVVSLVYPPPSTVNSPYVAADGVVSTPDLDAWQHPQLFAGVLRGVVVTFQKEPPLMTKPGGFTWGWRGLLPKSLVKNGKAQYPDVPPEFNAGAGAEHPPAESVTSAAAAAPSTPAGEPVVMPPLPPIPETFASGLERLRLDQLEALNAQLARGDEFAVAQQALDPATTIGKLLYDYQCALTTATTACDAKKKQLIERFDRAQDAAAGHYESLARTTPALDAAKAELAALKEKVAAKKAQYAASAAVPKLQDARAACQRAVQESEEAFEKAGDEGGDYLMRVHQPLAVAYHMQKLRAQTMYA